MDLPTADQQLDARGLKCPLPILRTKKALAELQSGQILHVKTTDQGARDDFPAFAQQTGNTLLAHQHHQEGDEFWLQRR